MRISLQVATGYFLIVGLAGWFVLDVFVDQVKPGVRNTMEDTLVDSANLMAEVVAPELAQGRDHARIASALARFSNRDVDAAIWDHRKQMLELGVIVTDAAGMVLFATDPGEVGRDYSRWNDIHRTLSGGYGARSTRADPEDPATAVMHVAAPVLAQGEIIGVVSLSKPGYSVEPIIEDSKVEIRSRGLLLLVIAALIGGLFTWHLTGAIGRLHRYAREVTSGARVAPPRSSARELSDLAGALGEMRDRLEGKQYVERYLHTLTHELKSPLAAIRGAAELLGEGEMPDAERTRFLDNIRNQADRLSRVSERLLELARVEQRQALDHPETIELVALVRACADGFAVEAARRSIGLHIDVEGDFRVNGDRFLLHQAVVNLLDNAIGFSPVGGRVSVCVDASERRPGGVAMVQVRVCDQGPGVPDYARDKVFERFFSLPRTADGPKSTGLGLSFVREVAELHAGEIMLEPAADAGTCARLRLPASR